MRKYNVLHLITQLELGGAQKTTIHTVEKLDKSIYNIYLAASDIGHLNEYARSINEVTFIEIPELKRKISPFYDLLVIKRIANILDDHQIDIIHTHSSKAGILGRIAAKIAKTPIVIHTIHGFGFHDYQPSIIKKMYIHLERFTSKFTDKLIAVSSFNIEKGLSHKIADRSKYLTIHSGIDIALFSNVKVSSIEFKQRLGITGNEFVVGQVGNFKPQKNPLDFLRMAKIVEKKFPTAKFLLIGDGPLRGKIERFIKDNKLTGKIILTGWRQDIPELMSILDVLVLSSLWEGLPQVFPQAMASGIPIVATNVDGAPEAIAHGVNGYLVEPGDYKGLANYVNVLLANPLKIRQMGNVGRDRVNPSFCVNAMVENISKLYIQQINDKLGFNF